MYLRQAYIENNGSLHNLNLKPQFNQDESPKPIVLVGLNGGGKTNFLSIVADALFEAASSHFSNVLPMQGLGKSWFRVVGGTNTTVGSQGSVSLLRFSDVGGDIFYKEKSGNVGNDLEQRVPVEFRGNVQLPQQGNQKEFILPPGRAEAIFNSGVYAFFPSNRSEIPHWLNRDAQIESNFEVGPQFSNKLRKKIYVDRAIDKFKQWILCVLADARVPVPSSAYANIQEFFQAVGVAQGLVGGGILNNCNGMLKAILADEHVEFMWLGRKSNDKVAVSKHGQMYLPSLDVLSSGQSIMLGLFGTILRYCDLSLNQLGLDPSLVEGICLIDEIDAHMHIEIQHKILPHLIKWFPKIQFVISSHSPLFVLGMEQIFGNEKVQIIQMPEGANITAESYSEFGSAINALEATNAFNELVAAKAREHGRSVVYVEGETDAPYLKCAAEVLGRTAIIENCDIEWIGSKDERGQGFHTGKDAMRQTSSFLKANPDLIQRKILLLHDNDTAARDEDYDNFAIRKLPISEKNTKVTAGIENLLPEICIEDRHYDVRRSTKANGDFSTTHKLRKTELCEEICQRKRIEEFQEFALALDVIERYINAA